VSTVNINERTNIMKIPQLSLIFGVALLLVSCQTISDQSKENLAKPVNCSTARQDIAALEKNKVSTAKKALTGVSAVSPVGAALTVASRQAKDKGSVVSGDYNRKIDQKIAEIERTCGV